MNKTSIITLATLILVGSNTHAQNLIRNGSFESPLIPTNTFSGTAPTFWTYGGTPPQVAAVLHNGNSGDASAWPLPEDGQQFADCGDNGQILSQPFTVTNQDTYTLTWFDSSGYNGLTTSPYQMTISNAAAQTVISTNVDAYHATFGTWVGRSLQVTLSPGTYTLTFESQGSFNGLDSLIDNVSLVAQPQVSLIKAVIPSFSNLIVGANYQLQTTTNVSGTFTNYGSAFTATNTSMNYPQYFNVTNWNQLFFQLQAAP